MSTNNGGPAFPVPNWYENTPCGMTLRDYFAAHAPEPPEDFGWLDGEADSIQRITRWNWAYADAMIAARGDV